MTKTKRLICTALAALMLTGCAANPSAPTATDASTAVPTVQRTGERTSKAGSYFNTVVILTVYDEPEGLLDEMMAECARYERLLSRTIPGSDVDRINNAGGETVTVDPETWEILRRAKEISKMTDGAFSVTIAAQSTLWDFTGGTNRMPTEEERLKSLELVDDEKLILGDNYTVTLPAGMLIDLGGIAKGYIADKLAEMCRDKVSCAMLNFGGNVYVLGLKPDGTKIRVGITDPQNTSTYRAVVTLTDKSVVTSGTYERYFVRDGVTYHHILDPKTGLSAQTDLTGATIILESSMDADALATACIVFGREKALSFVNEHKLDAVLIDSENNVYLSDGLAEHYPVSIVEPAK